MIVATTSETSPADEKGMFFRFMTRLAELFYLPVRVLCPRKCASMLSRARHTGYLVVLVRLIFRKHAGDFGMRWSDRHWARAHTAPAIPGRTGGPARRPPMHHTINRSRSSRCPGLSHSTVPSQPLLTQIKDHEPGACYLRDIVSVLIA